VKINYSQIDNGIVDLIKLLNEKGFETCNCCSGLYCDHQDRKEGWTEKYLKGYIGFNLSPAKQKQLITMSYHSCLKYTHNYQMPIFRFDSSDLEQCLLVDKLKIYTQIEQFSPVINISHKGDIVNIGDMDYPKKMKDITVNHIWKLLYRALDGL
jgi:hypothetical protein